MTDKELIKQEIQRRISYLEQLGDREYIEEYFAEQFRFIEIYESLIKFIDSLPEEPLLEDGKSNTIKYDSREDGIYSHATTYSFNIESQLFPQLTEEQQKLWRKEIENACISGGFNGLNLADDTRYDKEEHNEDLEETAINAWNKYSGLELMHIEEVVAFFREAAEWQKQQMMKDAVDATIFSELKGSDGSLFQAKSDRFRMNGVKINDKIKVIPIKN